MVAMVEVSGDVIDPELWDALFQGALVLAIGVAVALIGPGLLWRLLRRTSVAVQGAPGAETTPQGVEAVGRIARALAVTDPRAPSPQPAGHTGRAAPPVRGRAGQQPSDASCRRKHLRREGRPTRVHLSDGQGEPTLCWVVNRSRGGLGIALDRPVNAGTGIKVRPVDAPEDVPWVQVLVRNCRRKGKRWYLGCQFTTELPWSLILLFG
jgi:hypothetical protein